MNITRAAVQKPVATWMSFLSVSLLGIFALMHLPVDLMPNVGSSSLTVMIGIRGGLPPEDIEFLVVKPVEDAVSTTQHLRSVMSVARKDRSVTTLTFEPGTDVAFAALEVQERLAKIKNKLPKDIEKPIVAHYSEGDYPIVILALTSDHYSPEQLRDLVDNNLKPILARVDGVANVEVGGGRERKILVEFDQGRLEAYGLNIRQVVNDIGANNLNLLSGRVERERDSYYVRTMGQFQTIDDIKHMAVSTTQQGSKIRVQDIAEVRDFYLEAQSYARLNKKPTVSVYVQKESNTNTIHVADRVKKAIAKFQKNGLPEGIELITVSDQSVFINEAVNNVVGNLTWGAILTWFIIFLFLRDWKHTTVVCASIPLTLFITFSLMYLTNLSLNVMTLSGLALGVGMVVDGSTVVLENIVHKKRHALKKNPNADLAEATVEGTSEMSVSLIGSTLTTIVVFLPIVFINKQVKILYSGLAYTVTFSIVSSLIVAVTFVPLLASRLALPQHKGYIPPELAAWWLRMDERFGVRAIVSNLLARRPFWVRWIQAVVGAVRRIANGIGYQIHKHMRWLPENIAAFRQNPRRTFVRWCADSLRYQKYIFMGIVGLTLITIYIYIFHLEKEFMGQTEQNEFVIFVELPSGTKLDISDSVVGEVEKILSDTPEIAKQVKTTAARVEGWSSKLYVTLVPRSERAKSVQDVIRELRPKLTDVGAVYDAFVYFSEPESSKEFLIDVFGQEYDTLRDIAGEIAKAMEGVKGFTDVKLRYKAGQPEYQIKVDKDRAALFGLTIKDVAETLHAQIRGLRASYFYTSNQQIEIINRDQEKFRKTLADIQALTIPAPDGNMVSLSQVATFDFALTPSEIWRKDKQRMIQTSANRERLALSTAAQKVRAALKKVTIKPGYYWQIGGDYVDMVQNEKEFRFAFVIMAGLVFIVLASIFESFIQPLIVMVTIPMALIGSIPLLWITHTPATMGVYIGMIMLGGIVVNSAIILVDQINLTRSQGMSLKKSVLDVSWSRASPVLNTSLTTIVDLLPMIWSKSESAQLWAPLALTVVGGMTVATFLTLFVVPQLYYYAEIYKDKFFQRAQTTPEDELVSEENQQQIS